MAKKINLQRYELNEYYQEHGIHKTAKHFKVDKRTIYIYIKKYSIKLRNEKKESDWYDTLPTEETYHAYWKRYHKYC